MTAKKDKQRNPFDDKCGFIPLTKKQVRIELAMRILEEMNNDYYHQDTLWDKYDPGKHLEAKTEFLCKLIPRDVTTILDVGCGNGAITNRLADMWDVTGLDFSAQALKHVKTKSILSSSTHIPLSDNSFDLVLCSELLEHLNQKDLLDTCKEMVRISSKYLIVTIPNQEQLSRYMIKCPQCGGEFHAWNHLQSFDTGKIMDLFGHHFMMKTVFTAGPDEQKWLSPLLYLRQRIGGQWFNVTQNIICPCCKNGKFYPQKSSLLTKACNLLNSVISGKKKYWLFVLLEKS